MVCPDCSANIADGARFCKYCGCNLKDHKESSAVAFCSECGARLDSDSRHCAECGAAVVREKNENGLDSFFELDDMEKLIDKQVSSKQRASVADRVEIYEGRAYGLKEGCEEDAELFVPDGVEMIGDEDGNLVNCEKVVKIYIPKSVNYIPNNAFDFCSSLEEITVDEENPAFKSVGGVLFTKDESEIRCYPAKKQGESFTIPDRVQIIPGSTFCECEFLERLIIGKGVIDIDPTAFYKTSFSSVIIAPDNPAYKVVDKTIVTKDGKTLVSWLIDIYCDRFITPAGVTSIMHHACYCHESLETLIIRDGVTDIGECAFFWCDRIKSVVLPEGLVSIDDSAFYSCKALKSIEIPDSVRNINDDAVCHTGIKSIDLPKK